MDADSDFKYWPCDDINILSERVLTQLAEYNEYERAWDNFGERSLTLIILGRCIHLPRFLTSKAALAYLGFTRTRVEELWQGQIRVPESMDGPNIECGGEYYFWAFIIQFLDDKISSARENAENGVIRSSKDLLDDMGLTRNVQRQELRVTSGDDQTIVTSLRAQMPKDALPLAKQYIIQRWAMPLGLNDTIDQRGSLREDIVTKFTQHPIEITAV